MIAARTRRGWIGVDVGTRAVKLAQLERTPSGLRLADAAVVPRRPISNDEHPHDGTPVAAQQEIATGLFSGTEFRGNDAACVLSMSSCQASYLKISAETEEEKRRLVAQELAAVSSSASDGQVIDFWSGQDSEGDANAASDHAIALSLPRTHVAQAASDLFRSRLYCRAIDGLPMAMARAVELVSSAENGELEAVLDWGVSGSTFCVVAEGVPTYVRRLRGCGFASVLQSAADEVELETDELEMLLVSDASRPPEIRSAVPAAVNELLLEFAADPLGHVVDELRRTLSFLKSQAPAVVPKRLWIMGAGALWSGAAGLLSSRLNLGVKRGNWGLRGLKQAAAGCLPARFSPPPSHCPHWRGHDHEELLELLAAGD